MRAERPAPNGAPSARGRMPGPAAIELPSATYRLIIGRTRRLRPEPLRDPARLAGQVSGGDGGGHRGGHRRRIGGPGDRGGQKHGVATQFHRQRGVARGADTGVEDHGHPGPLDDHLDVVRVGDAQPGADRRAQRHHRRAADVLEPTGQHRVVVGVRQNDEPVVDQLLCGPDQFDGIGQQRALVGDDLELDPVGLQRLAGQLRGEHRLGGAATARGVGQRGDAEPVQQVQHPGAALAVDAAHRHGGQLGARRDQRLFEHREVGRAAGAQDQPRAEAAARDREFLSVSHPAPPSPPPPARRRPASSPTPIAAAPPSPPPPRCPCRGNRASNNAATVVCSSISTASSLTVTFMSSSCFLLPASAGTPFSSPRIALRGPRRQQESGSGRVPRPPACARRAGRRSAVVRRHRAQPGGALGEFVLAQRRHHRARVVEQFAHARHGGRGVATVLVLRGADDHAVGAGAPGTPDGRARGRESRAAAPAYSRGATAAAAPRP